MSKLLINEPPLQVIPSLAVMIGLNEAMVLQQVHYWLPHAKTHHKGKQWIYKTVENWKAQDFPFWDEKTIRNVFKSLRKKNLILVEKLSSNKQVRVNYYTINYKQIEIIEKKHARGLAIRHAANITESIWQYLPNGCGKSYLIHSEYFTFSMWQYLPNVKENNKENTQETKKESTKEKQAPLNFSATKDQVSKMEKYGINPDLALETFLAEAKAEGKIYYCWESALTLWINKVITDSNLKPLHERIDERLKVVSDKPAKPQDSQYKATGYHPSHDTGNSIQPVKALPSDNWHWKDPLPNMSIPETYKYLEANKIKGELPKKTYDRLFAKLLEQAS